VMKAVKLYNYNLATEITEDTEKVRNLKGCFF
jgi:hypothetical protein